ncbi:MAG: cob(I)yrinic acid a,c-diamide adenosyltransferase [Eubacteriales bacterium]
MGFVHIYCGDGKGKTTASVGLAVRAAGSGMRVLFAQFFKDGHSSEVNAMKQIQGIECMAPKKTFGLYKNMNITEKEALKIMHNDLLNDIIASAGNYDMIVFDEIISAYNHMMIDQIKLLNFIKHHSDSLELVMTGRNPSEDLICLADYVSEIKKIKHPFNRGVEARFGIEF